MSIQFTPLNIDFSRLATSISYETQNTTASFEMDTGSHTMEIADPTIEILSVSFDVNINQYKELIDFFRLVKSTYFYATFPDVANPETEKGKFYCFNRPSTQMSVAKKGNSKYTIDFTLNWHFRVTGIDRV